MAQSRLQEPHAASGLALLERVMEAGRDLDEPLQELSRLPHLAQPGFLPGFVRFEESALVEERASLPEGCGRVRRGAAMGLARRRQSQWDAGSFSA